MKLAEPFTVGVVLAILWLCHQQSHHTFSRHISCWRSADIMTHTFPSSLLGNHSLIRHYSARYKAADTLPYHQEHFDNPSVLLWFYFVHLRSILRWDSRPRACQRVLGHRNTKNPRVRARKASRLSLPSRSWRQRGMSFGPHCLMAEEDKPRNRP